MTASRTLFFFGSSLPARRLPLSTLPHPYSDLDRAMKSSGRLISLHRHKKVFSSSSNNVLDSPSPNDWRKKQLEKLENKFKATLEIQTEEDLQPMWKEMEGRVTRRKPRTLRDTGGKTGRVNIRKTDEEVWEHEGLYTQNDSVGKTEDTKNGS